MSTRAAGLLLLVALPAQELTLSREQMTADLQQLVRAVSRRWAYAEDRATNAGVDLSAMAAAATLSLANVRQDADFVAIVREFVAGMQDGHAWVSWTGTEPRPFRRWPFTVVDTHEGLVVDELLQTWNDTAVPARRQELLADERRAMQRALAPAAAAKSLVLDLRGNGGGTDLLAMEVAGHLIPNDATYYRLASRNWLAGWNAPSSHRLQCSADVPPLPCKLIVLIDAGTFSAADNLCRCLHDLHPEVTFVGEATGGGTGAPRALVTLEHSKVVIGACTMRVFGPKGELIEGRGTAPDVTIVPTREAWLAGRDEALEAALAVAR